MKSVAYRKLPRIKANLKPEKEVNYDVKNLVYLIRNKSNKATILHAVKIGYLLYPSVDFICKIYESQTNREHDVESSSSSQWDKKSKILAQLQSIMYLNFNNVPIIEVGDVRLCQNLRILNLSSNYLFNIDPLVECKHLLRLDLQNNQLDELPPTSFWAAFERLKILYLHSNQISKIENLKNLTGCPSLEILTLFDTPVSLRSNYRHHVVNSIFTLKALDDYVISDEEIIEDATFANMFSPRLKHFKLELTLPTIENNSFKDELRMTYQLMKKVNHTLAHYSPVLIIQKHVRGLLARKRYKILRIQLRTYAAVRIQRWWLKVRTTLKNRPNRLREHFTSHFGQGDQIPASISTKSKENSKQSTTPAPSLISKKNIIVDLNKLHKRQHQLLDNSSSISNSQTSGDNFDQKTTTNKISPVSRTTISHTTRDNNHKLAKLIEDKKLDRDSLNKIYELIAILNREYNNNLTSSSSMSQHDSLRSFLNELFNSNSNRRSPIDFNLTDLKQIENQLTKYRLINLNNSIIKRKENFVYDLVKEKIIGINAVKQMQLDSHNRINELKQLQTPRKEHEFVTNDQRFFQKIYGNMTLGSLRAVDKAYEERSNDDGEKLRQKNVELLKEMRAYSLQQVEYYKEDRVKEARENHNQDKTALEVAKLKAELDSNDLKSNVKYKSERLDKLKKQRQRDIMMAIDFSKQHLSVSKALQRHEFLTLKESKLKKNADFASYQKAQEIKQKELIKKYLEQRNMLRLTEARKEKAIIESRLREDSMFEQYENVKRVQTSQMTRHSKAPTKSGSAKFLYYDFDSNLNRSENQIDYVKYTDYL